MPPIAYTHWISTRCLLALMACAAGCHVHAARPTSATKPIEAPRHAPVYTDGPVQIPGEPLNIPYVKSANGKAVVVPPIAPGARVAFQRQDGAPPTEIFLKRHQTGKAPVPTDVWRVPAKTATPSGKSSTKATVSFEVPALPAGVYDAWYVGGKPSPATGKTGDRIPPPSPKASQSVTFEIKPTLRAAKAVVHAAPGGTVDVAVGVAGPIGAAEVTVTLDGFNAVAQPYSTRDSRRTVGADGLAHFKVRVDAEGDVYLFARSPGYASLAIRVVGGEEYPVRVKRLQPGDALLCQGRSHVAPWIQRGERFELGLANPLGRPWYSHVAIYLGDEQTAEMLDEGLVRHTLQDTIDGCTVLDVYRRVGITKAQQDKLVQSVRSMDWVPYAWFQIGVLGSAGRNGIEARGSSDQRLLVWYRDRSGVLRFDRPRDLRGDLRSLVLGVDGRLPVQRGPTSHDLLGVGCVGLPGRRGLT